MGPGVKSLGASNEPPAHRREVLVVDDDEEVRRSLCDLLREAGYPTIAVSNGAQALHELERLRDSPPGLVLLDLAMPTMSGPEFLEQYSADTTLPAIPVVVLSANLGTIGTYCRGVLLYLNKPFDVDRLMEIVALWCG